MTVRTANWQHRQSSEVSDGPSTVSGQGVGAGHPTVRIDVLGVWADVHLDDGAHPATLHRLDAVLSRVLTLTLWSAAEDSSRGVVLHSRPIPVIHRTADEILRIDAGLVPTVVAALEHDGWTIEVSHYVRPAPPPGTIDAASYARSQPDLAILRSLAPAERAMLEQALTWQHAVLAATGANSIRRLVVALCRLFPAARIMIVAGTQDQVYEVGASLHRSLGDDQVSDGLGGALDPWRRCHVVTSTRLSDVNPDDWDVVLLLDARTGMTTAIRYGERLAQVRIYSFIPSSPPLARREALLMEMIYGPLFVAEPRNPTSRVSVASWGPADCT